MIFMVKCWMMTICIGEMNEKDDDTFDRGFSPRHQKPNGLEVYPPASLPWLGISPFVQLCKPTAGSRVARFRSRLQGHPNGEAFPDPEIFQPNRLLGIGVVGLSSGERRER